MPTDATELIECPMTVSAFRAVSRLHVTRPDARSGEDSKRLVAADLMRLTAYDKRHRLSCFQRCFEALLGLLDPSLEVAATQSTTRPSRTTPDDRAAAAQKPAAMMSASAI
jgi:hypothetical protein